MSSRCTATSGATLDLVRATAAERGHRAVDRPSAGEGDPCAGPARDVDRSTGSAAGGARDPGRGAGPAALAVARDRSAISHHYDLSNDFYAFLLDPHLAYSCAWFADGPGMPLEAAQAAKLDLVCRKVGLDTRAPGSSTSAAAGGRCRCMPPSTSVPGSPG